MEFDKLQQDLVNSIQIPPQHRSGSKQVETAKWNVACCEKISDLITEALARKKGSRKFLEELDWNEDGVHSNDGEVIARLKIKRNTDVYNTLNSFKSTCSKIEIAQLGLQLEDFHEISNLCYKQYRDATKSFFESTYFIIGLLVVLLFITFGIAMVILDPLQKSVNALYAQVSIASGLALFLGIILYGLKSWLSKKKNFEYNSVFYKTMIALYLKCKNILAFENTPFRLRACYACRGFEVVKDAESAPSQRSSLIRDKLFTIVVEEDSQIEFTEEPQNEIFTILDTPDDC